GRSASTLKQENLLNRSRGGKIFRKSEHNSGGASFAARGGDKRQCPGDACQGQGGLAEISRGASTGPHSPSGTSTGVSAKCQRWQRPPGRRPQCPFRRQADGTIFTLGRGRAVLVRFTCRRAKLPEWRRFLPKCRGAMTRERARDGTPTN